MNKNSMWEVKKKIKISVHFCHLVTARCMKLVAIFDLVL